MITDASTEAKRELYRIYELLNTALGDWRRVRGAIEKEKTCDKITYLACTLRESIVDLERSTRTLGQKEH